MTDCQIVQNLRSQLAALDECIAAFNAECERTSGHAVNPDNEIGGMRNRSARAKGRMMDRWDAQAREARRLHDERATLVNRIAWLESAPIRERAAAMALAAWDALRVGDANPLTGATIVKRNPKSIVTTGGNRWTCEEVTGLGPARVAELRAAQAVTA